MIRTKFTLLSDGCSIDFQTNLMSIFNVVEGMDMGAFPALVQRLLFLTLFERDAVDDAQYESEFSASMGGRELLRHTGRVDFSDKLRARAIVNLAGLVIPQPGRVLFRLAMPAANAVAEYSLDAYLGTVANTPASPRAN